VAAEQVDEPLLVVGVVERVAPTAEVDQQQPVTGYAHLLCPAGEHARGYLVVEDGDRAG
jgi:hypothetical protein